MAAVANCFRLGWCLISSSMSIALPRLVAVSPRGSTDLGRGTRLQGYKNTGPGDTGLHKYRGYRVTPIQGHWISDRVLGYLLLLMAGR